ncbi:MAG: universal stress protein [Acidimicrobiales bacterium]
MFDRILIPLDGSLPATSALYAGEQLADRLDADLHVLTLTGKGRDDVGLGRLIERQVARIEGRPKVDVRPLSYSVAEDIAGEFDKVDETLVVMSTWARGRVAGVFGNVAEDVLRMVRHPVVMLGPEAVIEDRWLAGPLLVTTDGSHFGDSIAPFAERFGSALDLQPQLITVVDPTKVPAGLAMAAESNSVAGLAAGMTPATGGPVAYDVLHGSEPAREIADYANRYEASMIAMSTHGRSGAWRVTSGSVAMDVVRHARCPVLLSRPPSDEG